MICFIWLIPPVSASIIQLEYFHTPQCLECENTAPTVSDLEDTYGESLNVEEIDVNTPDGWKRWKTYGFLEIPAVVVNGTIKIPREEITEENVRAAIEQSLSGTKQEASPCAINWDIPLAYTLGLFSGFSPCQMAILGFLAGLCHRIGRRLAKHPHELADIRPGAGCIIYCHGVLRSAGRDVAWRIWSIPHRRGGADHDPRRCTPDMIWHSPVLFSSKEGSTQPYPETPCRRVNKYDRK